MSTPPVPVHAELTGTVNVTHVVPETPPPDPSALSADDLATLKDARAADIASLAAFHASLTALATGSVERARAGATATVTAASTIATVYAGLLALVFSADGNALPTRALLSPIFFAIAIAAATAYLAFIIPSRTTRRVDETGGWGEKAYKRTQFYLSYVRAIVRRRVWMLQAGVIALAIAILTIAFPFVAPGAEQPEKPGDTTVAVEWPAPGQSSGDPALDALLYDAQLKQAVATADVKSALAAEAAADEAAAAAAKSWMDSSTFFWSALAVGVAVVIFVPSAFTIAGRAGRTG